MKRYQVKKSRYKIFCRSYFGEGISEKIFPIGIYGSSVGKYKSRYAKTVRIGGLGWFRIIAPGITYF